MDPPVLTARDGAVGRITLNRPEAMNAITTELGRSLEAALRELGDDEAITVIVIRGAGGNFCVGGDFKHMLGLRDEGEEALAGLFDAFCGATAAIAESDAPVMAVVEGAALAGGFELILACDVVIARSDARIGDHHANFGMLPGGGSSQRLPRLVGRNRALSLILTGASLTGAQAVAWGLAFQCAPEEEFEAAVEKLIAKLASRDRAAQARIKELVHTGLEEPLAEGLARERSAIVDHVMAPGSMDRFTKKDG